MSTSEILLEGGNALVESAKGYSDIAENLPGSIEAASALLGFAGVAFGLVGKIEAPFTQAPASSEAMYQEAA